MNRQSRTRQKSTAPVPSHSAGNGLPAHWAGKNVLVSITGLSPAVLTETVWALAHLHVEKIIPDVIVVLTTIEGRKRLEEQLFGPDQLWTRFRAEILGTDSARERRLDFDTSHRRLKVFTRRTESGREELNDLNRLTDTEAVGNDLVEELWGWVGREDHRVIASISGGFKTMSALLYGTMSLLGRSHDRIVHVLVNEPYDGRTRPFFHWPGQPLQELASMIPEKSGTFAARDAVITMGEVEFPTLTRLFGDYGFSRAPTFTELVERCRSDIDAITREDKGILTLRLSTLSVSWKGQQIDLGAVPFFTCFFFAGSKKRGCIYKDFPTAARLYQRELEQFMQSPEGRKHFGALRKHLDGFAEADGEKELQGRLSKAKSQLLTRFERGDGVWKQLAATLSRRLPEMDLPADRIEVLS